MAIGLIDDGEGSGAFVGLAIKVREEASGAVDTGGGGVGACKG